MDLQKILDFDKTSPMMKQYIRTKLEYMDTVLFYRLGDFYEFFFDDAIEMSRVLDLTLTGKDCALDERAPMCGIPYHAAEGYINKLISLGYKVAICEQTTDPKDKSSSKDIVKREVVKIVTAGTIIDENMLDEKRNNYIACIYNDGDKIGFSYTDISVGEIKIAEFDGENKLKQLNDILVRVMPSEILCYSSENIEKDLPVKALGLIPNFSYDFASNYNFEYANQILTLQFGADYVDTFCLSKNKHSVIASGVLFGYIKLTQKRDLGHFNQITKVDNTKFMVIDVNTRRNLEILETMIDRKKKGALISVMDKTKTSMGARLIRSWIEQPLYDAREINLRLDSVEELCSKLILRDNLSEILKKCSDIERISGRIAYGNFSPKDCLALSNTLMLLPELKNQLGCCKTDLINSISENIGDFSDIKELLNNAIVENPPFLTSQGGFIQNGYNSELDSYRNAQTEGSNWIIAYEAQEREKTGIKNLKVSFNKVYGYYIEVNKSLLSSVPIYYTRKQTVANNERFITEELKILEEKILGAEESAIKLEQAIFSDIKNRLLKKVRKFQETATAIATLDCLLSLSDIAIKNNYCKPKINSKINYINIVEGRHPVVEEISKDQFIPNDTLLDSNDSRTMIITGPNMAGKSTYMRQVALITLMAHIGSFVPAKSAEIALTDRIFTRVGASDDLSQGQSTFMVEMKEVANILDNATDNSLIILDEIGRGTSTFDGLSIAWAVVEYLSNNMHAKTLFSTHYHELTELENFLSGVKNYRISVKEFAGNIVFLRKIVRGGAHKSFGVEVAALAGVKDEVIKRAKEISSVLEQNDSTKSFTIETSKDIEKTKQKDVNYTEIIGILKDLNMDTMSPISAFETLCNLVEKAKK